MTLLCYDEVVWADPVNKPPLRISITAPEKNSIGDYSCRVIVDGLSIRIDKEQFGITKAQAICLSLRLVTQAIVGCAEFGGGQLMMALSDGTLEPLTAEMIGADVFQRAEW